MEKKSKIIEYRERFDKTLASPNLANVKVLKTLVRNQLLHSSKQENKGYVETVIEKRTSELSNFLQMLKSASVDDNGRSKFSEATTPHPEWKLKEENEEFRVMYREGPQGTPYHTLLVEGYVDAPADVCLGVSWESALYKKWWPQSTIPTFKILSCECLQKAYTGEQISLVRVKVSWPLSTREAIVHYFCFEYFEDDLVVVLLNTIFDSENISSDSLGPLGFTNKAIPEAKDVVRIDVVGGFAMQKVTSERGYFRTIVNMDIKLDIVPPSIINFISRQLIGNGFKLYKKAVASKLGGDESFSEALKNHPLYARIREGLYSVNESNRSLEKERNSSASDIPPLSECSLNTEPNIDASNSPILYPANKSNGSQEGKEIKIDSNILEEDLDQRKLDEIVPIDQKLHCDSHANRATPLNEQVMDKSAIYEIEEIETEEIRQFEDQILTKKIIEKSHVNGKRNVHISSEVKEALGTLEKVISMVKDSRFNAAPASSSSGFTHQASFQENDDCKDPKTSEDDQVFSKQKVSVDAPKKVLIESTSLQESFKNSSSAHNSRRRRSNSFSKEVNHNRIAPVSPEQKLSVPCDTNVNEVASYFTKHETMELPTLESNLHKDKSLSSDMNSFHQNRNVVNGVKKSSKQKRQIFCCFSVDTGQLINP